MPRKHDIQFHSTLAYYVRYPMYIFPETNTFFLGLSVIDIEWVNAAELSQGNDHPCLL